MQSDIAIRNIPSEAISQEMRRVGADESSVLLAMQELAQWCIKHQIVIAQGRPFGFRLGATPMVKDMIAMACSSSDEGAKITGNIQNIPA